MSNKIYKHYQSLKDWGKPPISIARPEEIINIDLTVSGVTQLPNEDCYELFIYPENDVYIGGESLQNIFIPAGSIVILDIANTSVVWASGSTILHLMILK